MCCFSTYLCSGTTQLGHKSAQVIWRETQSCPYRSCHKDQRARAGLNGRYIFYPFSATCNCLLSHVWCLTWDLLFLFYLWILWSCPLYMFCLLQLTAVNDIILLKPVTVVSIILSIHAQFLIIMLSSIWYYTLI